MLWILHKKTIITISGFLLPVLLSVFFFSPSYATSVDCSPTLNANTYDLTSCDFTSLDSSKTWYYDSTFKILATTSTATWYYDFPALPNGNYVFRNASFTQSHINHSFSVLISDLGGQSICIQDSLGCGHFEKLIADSNSINNSIELLSIKVYDDITIPDFIRNPQLDDLTTSIYVLSSTLLVIYVFYCIYRMIIKGVK